MFDNFYQVSHRLASCKKMKKAHLIIIADTYSFNSKGKVNYKSQTRIAKECGASRKTVNLAIKDLRDIGILNVVESKFKETLKLTINKPNLMAYIALHEHSEVSGDFQASSKEDSELLTAQGWDDSDVTILPHDESKGYNGCVKRLHNKNTYKNIKRITNTPIQLSEDNRSVFEDLKDCSLDKEPKYFIDQLEESHFPLCTVAMEELKELKASYQNVYCGSQTMEDWKECESILEEITTSDEACDYDKLDVVALFVRTTYLKRCTERTSPIGLKFMTGLVKSIGVGYSIGTDYADLLDLGEDYE